MRHTKEYPLFFFANDVVLVESQARVNKKKLDLQGYDSPQAF
jgi:hypothetical protein